MQLMREFKKTAAVLAWVVFLPAVVYAQASVAGTVKDPSGAVLPGVTVEAASPALIEKVRTAVSDGTGQFRIEDLRPGTYTMTFTLTGFSTVKREGIELTGSFTASLNVEMKVGSVAETITVTSESPIVDIQSATRQETLSNEVLNDIPIQRDYNGIVLLVPGITTDQNQVLTGPTDSLFSMRGGPSTEGRIWLDGMLVGNAAGGGGESNFLADVGNAQEVNFITSGGLGEAEVGGPILNIVPRVGGNTSNGSFFVNGTGSGLQSSNYTQTLKNAGLVAPNSLLKAYDVDGAFGGPIMKDKLWYFANARAQGSKTDVTNLYYNLNAGKPAAWTYSPNLSQQAYSDRTWDNAGLRLTWQLSERNKLNLYWDEESICGHCTGATGLNQLPDPLTSPEANGIGDISPQRARQITWSSPVTSRVLLQAGLGAFNYTWGNSERQPNPEESFVRVTEQCSNGCAANGSIAGLNYRSSNWAHDVASAYNWQASASYVTGAQSLKVGYQQSWNDSNTQNFTNTTGLFYRVNNGVPNQLTENITPFLSDSRETAFALFAQEQWTLRRLTLQGALRYDRAWSWFPTQQEGPTSLLPVPLVFDPTTGVTGYNDISPRVAATYDLFGSGKTAIKVNLGKYLTAASTYGAYSGPNPTSRIVSAVTRTWNDVTGTFNPASDGCNLLNPAAQTNPAGQLACGAISNSNFGTTTFSNTYDPAILSGMGIRPSDWNFGASVQQQILPRTSVEVGYYVRWFQNFLVTDNIAVPSQATNYNAFSVTAPLDLRLPGGGGNVITGLYDVNPAYFGKVNNQVTIANDFGKQYQHWDGADVIVSSRPRNGLTFQGGIDVGQSVWDDCAIRAQLPGIATTSAPLGTTVNQTNPYCHVATGFLPQFRGLSSYQVPKLDVQFSAVFQSKPGQLLAANWTVPNSVVAQSLGRNLAGNAPNVTVNLIAPGTLYGDRINQLDLRLAKILKFGRTRTTVGLDVYNVLNTSSVLTYNQAYIVGGSWLTPTTYMSARLARFSAQFNF
jgi:hypothetical protein